MSELSSVLQEVLKALGIEGVERVGLYRGPDAGDHHRRPATVDAGGG